MKKANENEHPVYVNLRDWSKARKTNPVVAEKTEHVPSLTYISKERKRYDNKAKDCSGKKDHSGK
jgi:hypothetical protein